MDIKTTARRVVKKHNKKLDVFFKKELTNVNKDLFLVLKSHLFVESLMNKLIEKAFPKPSFITKKSFSEKIKLFEAIGLDNEDTELRSILFILNDIRNEFAHNFNFKLSSKEAAGYLKKFKVDGKKLSGSSNQEKFLDMLLYLTGYLRVMWSMNDLFPLMSAYARHGSFNRDKWFKSKKLHNLLDKEMDLFMEDKSLEDILTS